MVFFINYFTNFKSVKTLFFIIIIVLGILIYLINNYIFFTKFENINRDNVKVFILNLDRTPERYKKVKLQLDKNKIQHQRFSAIDGYNLWFVEKNTNQKFSGKELKEKKLITLNNYYDVFCPDDQIHYFSKKYFNIADRTLTAGEFGCYCSHRAIWKYIVSNNIEHALIFEDDITLAPDYIKKLDSLLKKLPPKWDIIYFYVAIYKKNNFYTVLNNRQIKKFKANTSNIITTAGYLLNKDSAKKLLDLSKYFSYAIDDVLGVNINKKNIVAYKTTDSLVTAPNFIKPEDSTIYDMGRSNY